MKKLLICTVMLFVLISAVLPVQAAKKSIIYGDVNGDGAVTDEDADLISEHLAKVIKLEGDAFIAADVNGDGRLSLADVISVQRYIANLITEFPIEKIKNKKYSTPKYFYDKLGRVIKVEYDENNYIEYTYDANGNIKNTVFVKDGEKV